MNYQFPIVATNRDGETRVLNDHQSFCDFAFSRVNGRVGAYWNESGGFSFGNYRGPTKVPEDADPRFWHHIVKNDWIIRDNCGRVVDKEDFKLPYIGYWGNMRRLDQRRAAEQGLPIPYTGTRRRWRSSKKWTKNGRNGAHNQRKGIKLYEDPLIKRGEIDDL